MGLKLIVVEHDMSYTIHTDDEALNRTLFGRDLQARCGKLVAGDIKVALNEIMEDIEAERPGSMETLTFENSAWENVAVN